MGPAHPASPTRRRPAPPEQPAAPASTPVGPRAGPPAALGPPAPGAGEPGFPPPRAQGGAGGGVLPAGEPLPSQPGAGAPAGPGSAFPDTVAPGVRLHPYYGEARNRLVQPDQVRVQTAYFWKKWVPLLGPDLAVLIVQLRNMCYYNPATGERRDWCFPSQATLAAAIGVKNTHTIANLLKRPYADLFVRVEERYRYDPLRRKKVRTTSLYHVRMDDPLTPEDAVQLAAELGAAFAPAAAARAAGEGSEGAGQDATGAAAGRHLTRKFRVGCAGPGAKISRQDAREDFASGSARNFRDEEGLLRESREDLRAAASPAEDPAISSSTARTTRTGETTRMTGTGGLVQTTQAPAPPREQAARPAAAAAPARAQARARAILARGERRTAHRLRGEPALGASGPVRLNAALEEVRRRLFGEEGGKT